MAQKRSKQTRRKSYRSKRRGGTHSRRVGAWCTIVNGIKRCIRGQTKKKYASNQYGYALVDPATGKLILNNGRLNNGNNNNNRK